ncbi:unnamed protein product [Urochloa decumbens]|uniref:GRF-type domain-containing protein n=1 Tax=Urochloa decumbens TaxID=240449 RepID=A0ABC9AB54_9POAL
MAGSFRSSSSRASWSGEIGARRSPIPYRVGPLAYEPAVFCYCRKKAALWISWSDDNPGRRYLKCFRARDGGCEFVRWYEGPHNAFVQGMLIDLRDAVWALKRERADLQKALGDAAMLLEQQQKETAALKKEAAEHVCYNAKLKKLERDRRVLFLLCVALGIVMLARCLM